MFQGAYVSCSPRLQLLTIHQWRVQMEDWRYCIRLPDSSSAGPALAKHAARWRSVIFGREPWLTAPSFHACNRCVRGALISGVGSAVAIPLSRRLCSLLSVTQSRILSCVQQGLQQIGRGVSCNLDSEKGQHGEQVSRTLIIRPT